MVKVPRRPGGQPGERGRGCGHPSTGRRASSLPQMVVEQADHLARRAFVLAGHVLGLRLSESSGRDRETAEGDGQHVFCLSFGCQFRICRM